MKILKYGRPENPKIILIHGFMSPCQTLQPFIEAWQNDYCVIVPILPGHNPKEPEEFTSFDPCLKEIEDYCAAFGKEIFALYGMSMGGVFAAKLWQRGNLHINKLIMESSPLLAWENFVIKFMTKYYLSITHRAQKRVPAVLKQAVDTMVTEDNLEPFLHLLDKMSDETIVNYLKEVGEFSLPKNIDCGETEIYYFYGGKINELVFKGAAKFIKKHYPTAKTFCLKGKGHCEDALITPQMQIKRLNKILKQNDGKIC